MVMMVVVGVEVVALDIKSYLRKVIYAQGVQTQMVVMRMVMVVLVASGGDSYPR